MTIALTTIIAVAALGVAAYTAHRSPVRFAPYSEMLRNLSLLMGVVLLAWNMAISLTVLALDAGGLLVAGGFYEAQRIESSLVLVGPLAVLGVFGGAWLYLRVLDRWASTRRTALVPGS